MNKKVKKELDVKEQEVNATNTANSDKKVKEKKVKEKKPSNVYLGYGFRVVLFGLLFGFLFSISYFLVIKSLSFNDAKTVTYQDNGNIDYKVYLKPNEFYEQSYLGKNMVYVAGLIKNIGIDFNYQFYVDQIETINFNYSITGKLQISDDAGTNVYYSKDYVLLKNTSETVDNKTTYSISKNISIDYDYYNELANKFKTSYGIDASSNFIVTFRVVKSIDDININESNDMTVTIPLSQRAINIKYDSSGMSNARTISSESSVTLDNKVFVAIAAITFIASVAALLKFLELVFAAFGKKSEYDRYLDKIFKSYDRLIVETNTMPRFDDKNIIRIEKFEELLDARDTLKQPIMYFNISSHNKCYFYISKGKDVFLTVIKAVDLEEKNDKKKKKSKKQKI